MHSVPKWLRQIAFDELIVGNLGGGVVRYLGGPIVSDDSFRRQLPLCVAGISRLQFDAIVVACDVTAQAYDTLRESTTEFGDDTSLSERDRALVIGQCWVIIDQLHSVRQLLRIPGDANAGPLTADFFRLSSPASTMRNGMDHLRNNIGNLANKKGARMPIFGVLSYIYSKDPLLEKAACIAVMAGSLHGDDHIPMVNPTDRDFQPPVDHFQLSAFGETFEFSPALGALCSWVRHVGAHLAKDVEAQAQQRVADSNDSLDELLAKRAAGLTIIMRVERTISAELA